MLAYQVFFMIRKMHSKLTSLLVLYMLDVMKTDFLKPGKVSPNSFALMSPLQKKKVLVQERTLYYLRKICSKDHSGAILEIYFFSLHVSSKELFKLMLSI